MNFTSISSIIPENTPIVTVPVRPFCSRSNPTYMRIYAVPVGIDHGHIGQGSLIYKCVDCNELVQLTKFDHKFEGLHGAQLDDIDSLEGCEFTFNENGEYGVCDFAVPSKIRNRNTYISEAGVIQWESRIYSYWHEESSDPEVYQWDPKTDKVRKLNNDDWSEWTADYVIDHEDYSVRFDLPDLDSDDDLPF